MHYLTIKEFSNVCKIFNNETSVKTIFFMMASYNNFSCNESKLFWPSNEVITVSSIGSASSAVGTSLFLSSFVSNDKPALYEIPRYFLAWHTWHPLYQKCNWKLSLNSYWLNIDSYKYFPTSYQSIMIFMQVHETGLE